jgi:O-antigen/teichoic acid export membrane protein
LSSVSNSLLFAANRQKTVALFTIFATVIGVALNFALLPMFSFIGAAFSVVLVSLIVFLFSFYHALRIVKFSKFGFVLKSLFCSVLMSLIVLFFPLRNFFILVLLGFLAYFASMFLVHGFDSDDVMLLKKVLKGRFVGNRGFSE